MSEKQIVNNQTQIARINKFKQDGANLIKLCEFDNLPEFHRLVVERVDISSDPEDKEIYQPFGVKGYVLHLAALEKIGVAANVEWDLADTRATVNDDKQISYRATGFITREFAKRVVWIGEDQLVYEFVEEELREECEAKVVKQKFESAAAKEKHIADKARKGYIYKRKNGLKLMASSAKATVLGKLFNIRKPFPLAAFKKPFIVIRCVVAPDLNDPKTKLLLTQSFAMASRQVFGGGPQLSLPQHAGQTVIDLPIDMNGAQPETTIEGKTVKPSEDSKQPDWSDDAGAGDPPPFNFAKADKSAQLTKIRELATEKGFPMDIITKAEYKEGRAGVGSDPNTWDTQKRIDFYAYLGELPYPTAADDDDIPY